MSHQAAHSLIDTLKPGDLRPEFGHLRTGAENEEEWKPCN